MLFAVVQLQLSPVGKELEYQIKGKLSLCFSLYTTVHFNFSYSELKSVQMWKCIL